MYVNHSKQSNRKSRRSHGYEIKRAECDLRVHTAVSHDVTLKEINHLPVLYREVMDLLEVERGGIFLDGTFGGGGHARAILNAHVSNGLIALDRDPSAKERAKVFESEFQGRFKFYGMNFSEIDAIEERDFSGILFDLGVSSFQLDQGERGFSFSKSGAIDMRMNPEEGLSASAFLEHASREDLIEAVKVLGEEDQWYPVVNAIIQARNTGLLQRTESFAALLEQVIRVKPGVRRRIHPATKTFQGIRMKINRELESIEAALPKAVDKLKEGGILAVIAFHSLEDRIVKRFFRRMAGQPEHSSDALPQQMRVKRAELLTRHPIVPSDEEVAFNPRSRSAKLRGIRKLSKG